MINKMLMPIRCESDYAKLEGKFVFCPGHDAVYYVTKAVPAGNRGRLYMITRIVLSYNEFYKSISADYITMLIGNEELLMADI